MHQRQRQTDEIEALYRQAVAYNQKGDVYNAVKVCKLIARLSPDWSAPYAYLGGIYKKRKEWKPTLHYCLKAIEHNPFNDLVWENMALAATVMENWQTARQAWNQLGFRFKNSEEEIHLDLGLVPIRLNPTTRPEIVEASRIDPARAVILSIPQPSSGRRYKDVLLTETKPGQSLVTGGRKLGVFDEIQVLKSSMWRTFAVILHTSAQDDVNTLAQLCDEAELGFDNWSNAARYFQPDLHPRVSEYFDNVVFEKLERNLFLVAIAARHGDEVIRTLKNWEVITLKKFEGLECLF